MKRTFFLILFAFMVVAVFAQIEQNEIIKSGEMKLTAGKAEIKEQLPQDYCVIVTPQGQCGQLYVTERTKEGFVVKETVVPGNKKSSSSFAYIVIEKKNIVVTKENSDDNNIEKISNNPQKKQIEQPDK